MFKNGLDPKAIIDDNTYSGLIAELALGRWSKK